MLVISPIQEKILCALGKYKFLTSLQAWTIIGNKNIQSIYNDLRILRGKELVDCIVYGGVSKSGTMHKLNYLTTKGAKVVAEILQTELDSIKFPKSTNTLVKNDFIHRIHTIDQHIAFDKWFEQSHELLFFDRYFDKLGSQRKQADGALHSKTRVQLDDINFINPDVIFAYGTIQKPNLFVLEIANGLDTKRIVQQVKGGIYAAYTGAVADKYQLQVTPKLLVALEHEGTKNAVMQRVKMDGYLNEFEGLENFLFFALQAQSKESWATSWQDINGQTATLFD